MMVHQSSAIENEGPRGTSNYTERQDGRPKIGVTSFKAPSPRRFAIFLLLLRVTDRLI